MLAIPWYFKDVLEQSSLFGTIYFGATTITLFWGLYAGVLIDKYSRKKIFLVATTIGFLIVFGISLIGYINGEIPPALIALVFVATFFNFNIHYPTLYAFGQEVTTREKYGRLNSTLEVSGQSTAIISGAFAAVLLAGVDSSYLEVFGLDFSITPWELHEVFMLDAATYLIAFLLILSIKYQPSYLDKVVIGETIFKKLKAGLLFLKTRPALLHFGWASTSVFAVVLIQVHQLLPVYVDNFLKADAHIVALSESFYAFGALFAGFGIRWLFKNTHLVNGVLWLMIFAVISLLACYFFDSTYVLFIAMLVLGLSNAGSRVLRVTYLFERIPNHLIGRSTTVFRSANVAMRMFLIGIFAIPFFVEQENIRYSYLVCGVFVFISIIPVVLFMKRLKAEG